MHTNETKSLMTKERVSAVIILILLACGIFYGGVVYGKSHPSNKQFAAGARTGAFAQGGQFAGRQGTGSTTMGVVTTGQVLSFSGNNLTIKTANGSSRIILVGTSTPITRSVAGASSDVQTGSIVTVNGITNADGTLTARSVQLQPAQVMPAAPSR